MTAARARSMILAAAAATLAAAPAARAEGPSVSGVVESRIDAAVEADYPLEDGGLSFGAEQYANLRLKAALGERGSVYAAGNLAAAAGSSVPLSPLTGEPADPFVAGPGYAAAIELERLYYRIQGDAFDVDAGLQRLAFGFGLAWGPTDFLSGRNPLAPDARMRGRLAVAASIYPGAQWKARAFAAAGDDPLASGGEGIVAGLTAEFHGAEASAQALYAFEADGPGPGGAKHRLGLSLKVEAGAGIVLDALYELDCDWIATGDYFDRGWNALRGLEASAGADWSFAGGDFYVLAEYFYHGGSALDPGDLLDRLYLDGAAWSDREPGGRTPNPALPLGELNRRDYLYSALTWRIDDYTSSTLSCAACLDDASFAPSLSLEHEPFQGLSLGLSCRFPLDSRVFSSSAAFGELGPTHSGELLSIAAKARVKF
jgi:hypothetical protein